MIVDYDILTTCLLKTLTNKHGTNYLTIDDVKNVMAEIRQPLSEPLQITDEAKKAVANATADELLQEIIKCANMITDKWDRDNLTILQFLCKEYENKVNCQHFRDFIRTYNFKRNEIYSCQFGHSLSLYGCFMSLLDHKNSKDTCIIAVSIIEQQYDEKRKNFKLIYNKKEPLENITNILMSKNRYITKEQMDEIQYILAEPDKVTIEKATT